ncbi:MULTISPECIES: histidine kinase dimerization/phospho-acceptor domain-containing protein [Solirubrobacterales]|uniref:histidine kinase dimerization/phospho-acceptor domain-containing protein n=1 Tax=Solirubrobacterales TaxID=588673 RepID=UPI001304C660|nr:MULTISPECIES: histidine kinase dimerization/phospho-acceptor domain-containing protein [Solirubrobacterales]
MDDAEERLARLVHDVRTPLTIVLGFSDMLRRRGEDLEPEQRAEFVQRLDEAARDIQRLLDEARPT